MALLSLHGQDNGAMCGFSSGAKLQFKSISARLMTILMTLSSDGQSSLNSLISLYLPDLALVIIFLVLMFFLPNSCIYRVLMVCVCVDR